MALKLRSGVQSPIKDRVIPKALKLRPGVQSPIKDRVIPKALKLRRYILYCSLTMC